MWFLLLMPPHKGGGIYDLLNYEADRDVKLGAGAPVVGVPVAGDAHAMRRGATPDRSGPVPIR